MRRLWIGVIAVLLVVASLSIGVYIGLMLNSQPQSGNTPTPTPAPTASQQPTETSTPSPTEVYTPPPQTLNITEHNVSVTYSEYSRQTNDAEGTTTIVLSVEAEYQVAAVTLSYDRFELVILTSRGGLEPYPIYLQSGLAAPAESGSVSVGGNSPQVSFRLTFEFPTMQQSSMDGIIPFHSYELKYI